MYFFYFLSFLFTSPKYATILKIQGFCVTTFSSSISAIQHFYFYHGIFLSKLYIYPKCYETSNNESCTSAILGPSLSWADWAVRAILKIKFLVLILFLYTPSPCVTRFHVARNSSKPCYAEFHYNGIPQNRVMRNSNGIPSTVPLTRFSHNAEFRNSKNAR